MPPTPATTPRIHTPSDHLPRFPLPDDWERYCREGMVFQEKPSGFEFLWEAAYAGMGERYPEDRADDAFRDRARKRLDYEIGVVREVGYADYFLIVWDIAREAAVRGIPTLARGSAADSLLCYCLKISTVCPLRFNLYFERFLNRERMKFSKLADIDLDFPWDQREEMMAYVFEKYGEAHVAMIGGFNRFHGRAAVADIGKVFGLSESEVRFFTKRMPRTRADAVAQALDESILTRELPRDEDPYPEIIDLARHFEDFPRHMKMHPCGIVISRKPLDRLIPLQPSGRGFRMTQFDMDAVEDLGLIKIDLLGQAGLSVLRDVRNALRASRGLEVDLEKLPWEDETTWDLIASGNARGVHHIESPAMTSLLVQSNCRDMDCLCAIVSVIRPGAADEAKKLAFTRRQQGFEEPSAPHPDLMPFLADTHGLLVYEEHILMVAHHFAGMNLGRSDVLRRELVKMKSPELLLELGVEFRECALRKGRTPQEAKDVWHTLVHFHGYMFNKAHSASYAVEAFHGAWLKARFPAVYMAAVLTNRRGFYSPLFYVLESRRHGVRMAAPDVNLPHDGFVAESDTLIRVPLTYIKGLGRGVLDRWREEIRRHPFRDAADFCRRVRPRPSEVQLLIDAGAFDGFGLSRPELFWQTRQLTGGAPGSRNGRRSSYPTDHETGDLFLQAEVNKADGPHSVPLASSQCLPKGTGRMPVAHSLRAAEEPPGGDDAGDDNDPPGLYSLPSPGGLSSPTTREMTAREYELFGFPVSLDPFAFFGGGDVHWDSYCSTADAANFHDQTIELCGIVMQTRRSHTSRGEIMEFCTLADPAGFIEAQLWPRTYRKFGHRVRHGEVIAATANVQPFDNKHGQVLEITRVGDPRR